MKNIRLMIVVAFALLCSVSFCALSEDLLSIDFTEPPSDSLTRRSAQIENMKVQVEMFFMRTLFENGHDCYKMRHATQLKNEGIKVYFVHCDKDKYTVKVFPSGETAVKKAI